MNICTCTGNSKNHKTIETTKSKYRFDDQVYTICNRNKTTNNHTQRTSTARVAKCIYAFIKPLSSYVSMHISFSAFYYFVGSLLFAVILIQSFLWWQNFCALVNVSVRFFSMVVFYFSFFFFFFCFLCSLQFKTALRICPNYCYTSLWITHNQLATEVNNDETGIRIGLLLKHRTHRNEIKSQNGEM